MELKNQAVSHFTNFDKNIRTENAFYRFLTLHVDDRRNQTVIEMKENSKIISDAFFEFEQRKGALTTKRFWCLAGFLWTHVGSRDPRWREAFERDGRSALHVNERVRFFSGQLEKDGGAFSLAFLKNHNLDFPIFVYRTFELPKNDKIRIRSVLNSKMQEHGAGCAFTLSKIKAWNWNSVQQNKVMLKKRGLDSSAIKLMRKEKTRENLDPLYGYSDLANYVGKFKITKKNIYAMNIFARFEEEIVADPMKAELISYKPITLEHAMIGLLVEHIFRKRDKFLYSDLDGGNEDRFINRLRKWLRTQNLWCELTNSNPKTHPELDENVFLLSEQLHTAFKKSFDVASIKINEH